MLADVELEKMLQKSIFYLTQNNRRKTFKKWIFSEKELCNATKMAEAGFIFIGDKNSPDAVKCFLCEKALDGWEANDDPWSEHIKHSVDCSFAKLKKAEELLTLEEFMNIEKEVMKKAINKYFDQVKEKIEECMNDLEIQLVNQPIRK